MRYNRRRDRSDTGRWRLWRGNGCGNTGCLWGFSRRGKVNAITDVEGVSVGHCTLRQGEGVRTGVTAILPHPGNLFREKVPAAVHVINGYGKTAGLVQVEELGTIESPILLTNTFSVPAVTEGALQYLMERDAGIGEEAGSVNVVVAECNDSYLNDMRGLARPPRTRPGGAPAGAGTGPVEEGCVGAGTGMVCFGWKGGIGTSSRRISVGGDRVSHRRAGPFQLRQTGGFSPARRTGGTPAQGAPPEKEADGSIIIVAATDLPMDAQQLRRLAQAGGVRTGPDRLLRPPRKRGYRHRLFDGQPDTGYPGRAASFFTPSAGLPEDGELLSHCFQAVAEATEEAIYNSLFTAETTLGKRGDGWRPCRWNGW